MPFPSTAGILHPDQFQLVKNVYDSIATEPWFTRASEGREQFALYVLDTFTRGEVDKIELLNICGTEARTRFGNGGLS